MDYIGIKTDIRKSIGNKPNLSFELLLGAYNQKEIWDNDRHDYIYNLLSSDDLAYLLTNSHGCFKACDVQQLHKVLADGATPYFMWSIDRPDVRLYKDIDSVLYDIEKKLTSLIMDVVRDPVVCEAYRLFFVSFPAGRIEAKQNYAAIKLRMSVQRTRVLVDTINDMMGENNFKQFTDTKSNEGDWTFELVGNYDVTYIHMGANTDGALVAFNKFYDLFVNALDGKIMYEFKDGKLSLENRDFFDNPCELR